MALAQPNPTTPGLPGEPPPRQQHAWESEQTLVDERRKLRYRIQRFLDGMWIWLVIGGLVTWALYNATLMRLLVDAVPYLLRFVTTASLIIGQFALMFWFLGKSRQYTIMPGAEGISFKDYRGQPELLEQAQQIVKLLRGVKVFEDAGGEPLNGLLLEGPPGTGKTRLAQAISTEAGVPFFFVDASSMNSMFIGIAPLKVANIYRKARRAAKEYGASIIFIDEIDAIGGSRGGVAQGAEGAGNDTADTLRRTRLPIMMGGMGGGGSGLLSTLLIEMSGFSLEHGFWAKRKTWFYKAFLHRKPPKPQKRVLTIGATNRIQVLDPALLRPGRFDKKIHVDVPDLEGRRDIIDYYLSKMAHDETIDSLILASETPNYTPADLNYLLNEALRYALFAGRASISIQDVRSAQPEHEFGIRQPIHNMTLEDKRRLAAHESGHALAIRMFAPTYRIARITIIRQGGAHGYVSWYPATEEFEGLATFESLTNRLRVAIGGKAGEMEFCGEGAQTLGVGIGFGDGSDFGQIRVVLQRMASAGMFGALGASSFDPETNKELRERMDELFRTVLEEVRMAFRIHRAMGEALIARLLQHEEMHAEQVELFFNDYGYYTPRVRVQQYNEDEIVDGQPPRDELPADARPTKESTR